MQSAGSVGCKTELTLFYHPEQNLIYILYFSNDLTSLLESYGIIIWWKKNEGNIEVEEEEEEEDSDED